MTKKLSGNDLIIKQGNVLVEAAYKLTLNGQRLLMYTLAKARERQELTNRHDFHLHASEFAEIFGLSKRNAYLALKGAVESLDGTKIKLANVPVEQSPFQDAGFQQGKVRGKTIDLEFRILPTIGYNEADGSVRYKLNTDLDPYIFDVVAGFTLSEIKHLAQLTCPNAMRFYTWFCRVQNLNNFDDNGGKRFQIEIEWIIERLGLGENYWQFKNMRRRILEPVLEQINSRTDLNVSYAPIYEGKTVRAVEFFYLSNTPMLPSSQLPVRPRLPRRPHVTKGTHQEGLWARRCIALLINYRDSLKSFDKRLSLADLRKLVSYYLLIGDTLNADKIQTNIEQRQNRKVA